MEEELATLYYNTLMFVTMKQCKPSDFVSTNMTKSINVTLRVPDNLALVLAEMASVVRGEGEETMSKLLDLTVSGIFLEGVYHCVSKWIENDMDDFLKSRELIKLMSEGGD